QEPVVSLLVGAAAHAYEVPAALELLPVENEIEIALAQALVRVAFRLPAPAIPDQHRAAAVFPLGNGAFELVVLDRMVLHLDGGAFVARKETGPAGHGPALHHPVELEAQVVVEPARRVLLHDELVARAPGARAARLRRHPEMSLLPIGLEGHFQTSCRS